MKKNVWIKQKAKTVFLLLLGALLLHNQRLSITDPENTYPKRVRRAIRLLINAPENELEKHLIGKGVACEESRHLYYQTASATVLIENGGGLGAGVFIAPRVIATAEHVVEGRDLKVLISKIREDSLALPSGSIPVERKYHVNGLDLAFLTTRRDGPSWLDLGINPDMNPNLMIVGHPKGRYYSLQKARIKKKNSITSSDYIFFKDNEVFFGNSGGAIVNCNGRLTGVVSMMNNYENSIFKEGGGVNARAIFKYAKQLNLL